MIMMMIMIVIMMMIMIMILTFPRATTGKLSPMTKMPSASSIALYTVLYTCTLYCTLYLANSWQSFSSQSMTGLMGWSSPARVKPALVMLCRNLEYSQRFLYLCLFSNCALFIVPLG